MLLSGNSADFEHCRMGPETAQEAEQWELKSCIRVSNSKVGVHLQQQYAGRLHDEQHNVLSNSETQWGIKLVRLPEMPPATQPLQEHSWCVDIGWRIHCAVEIHDTYLTTSRSTVSILVQSISPSILYVEHMITPRYSMLKLTAFGPNGEPISRLFIFRMMLRFIKFILRLRLFVDV